MKKKSISKIETYSDQIFSDINWKDSNLYHGTTKNTWEAIKEKGVIIPQHEGNWLGRGMYFGVNNILTPIKFALEKSNKGNPPIIIEIPAASIKQTILLKLMDLTNHYGLIYSYFISEKFKAFADELNRDDPEIQQMKSNFLYSPLYSDKFKKFLSLDMEWYLFIKHIEPIMNQFDFKSPFFTELKEVSKFHISNLIIDWFNYFRSGGSEEEIPIKCIVGNFNVGEPIFLSKYGAKTLLTDRIFFDFISFLNRTELSIFGFEYYKAYKEDSTWKLDSIFSNGKLTKTNCIIHEGDNQIKDLLSKFIKPYLNLYDVGNDESLLKSLSNELYEILTEQKDRL
jgi:hypothetical protein